MPYKDRVGQQFGRLTVLATERCGKVTYAHCLCLCGNTARPPLGDIVGGYTKSCGCLQLEQRKDITGQRFGKILVVGMMWDGKKAYCDIQCDCGNTGRCFASNILRGITKSCGCLKFGLRTPHIMIDGIPYKKCVQCERPKRIPGSFRQHKTSADGCTSACRQCLNETDNALRREHPEKYAIPRRVQGARRRARLLGLPEDFTSEDMLYALRYTNFTCFVCGAEEGLWNVLAFDHWIPISNPACPGTVPGNMVPLCHPRKGNPSIIPGCNMTKGKKDPEVWLRESRSPRQVQQILQRIAAFSQAAITFHDKGQLHAAS